MGKTKRKRKAKLPKYKLVDSKGKRIDSKRVFGGRSPLAAAKKAWRANKQALNNKRNIFIDDGTTIFVVAIADFTTKGKKRKMRSRKRRTRRRS